MDVGERFPISVGLKQGCEMPSRLMNVYTVY